MATASGSTATFDVSAVPARANGWRIAATIALGFQCAMLVFLFTQLAGSAFPLTAALLVATAAIPRAPSVRSMRMVAIAGGACILFSMIAGEEGLASTRVLLWSTVPPILGLGWLLRGGFLQPGSTGPLRWTSFVAALFLAHPIAKGLVLFGGYAALASVYGLVVFSFAAPAFGLREVRTVEETRAKPSVLGLVAVAFAGVALAALHLHADVLRRESLNVDLGRVLGGMLLCAGAGAVVSGCWTARRRATPSGSLEVAAGAFAAAAIASVALDGWLDRLAQGDPARGIAALRDVLGLSMKRLLATDLLLVAAAAGLPAFLFGFGVARLADLVAPKHRPLLAALLVAAVAGTAIAWPERPTITWPEQRLLGATTFTFAGATLLSGAACIVARLRTASPR